MKKSTSRLAIAIAIVALASPLFAYWTPLQVNLADVAGLPPAAESVYGIRINALYGRCANVACFDVGLFNRTTEGAYGIRVGAFNWSEKVAYGLSVAALNVDEYNAGLAIACFNYAKKGVGVQIGAINIADDFSGVQIGVLNFHFNSVVPVFPLFNMGSK